MISRAKVMIRLIIHIPISKSKDYYYSTVIYEKKKMLKNFKLENRQINLYFLLADDSRDYRGTFICTVCKVCVLPSDHFITCNCGAIICAACACQKVEQKKIVVIQDHFLDCLTCPLCK